MDFHTVFVDTNPEVANAYARASKGYRDLISVRIGNILDQQGDALVSPANSKGNMDGGIDQVYAEYLGNGVPGRVRRFIEQDYQGSLPVGKAVVVPTYHERFPYLVVAPTMEQPGHPIQDEHNIADAAYALFSAVNQHNANPKVDPITTLLSPGLGTGYGNLPPETAAIQTMIGFYRALDAHITSQKQ